MNLSPVRYLKGKYIIEEGKVLEHLIILLNGTVLVEKGGKIIHTIEEKNTFLGEISYLLQIPATASIKAEGMCTVLQIPSQLAENYFSQTPKMALTMCKILAERLNNTTNKMVDNQSSENSSQKENAKLNEENIDASNVKSGKNEKNNSGVSKSVENINIEKLKETLNNFFTVLTDIAAADKSQNLKNVIEIAQANIKNLLG